VVTEPRPADDQVPSTVLDELKLAFGDDDAADVPTVAADPLAVDVVGRSILGRLILGRLHGRPLSSAGAKNCPTRCTSTM
jgi:hypothetical protein